MLVQHRAFVYIYAEDMSVPRTYVQYVWTYRTECMVDDEGVFGSPPLVTQLRLRSMNSTPSVNNRYSIFLCLSPFFFGS